MTVECFAFNLLPIKLKKPSAHPKLAAVVDALIGALFLWQARNIGDLTFLGIWFGARIVWWTILVFAVYYPPRINRWWHLLTLGLFNLGATAFIIFIDWRMAWYFVGGWFVLAPAISFWLTPSDASKLKFAAKPFRRWCLLLAAFGLAGLWSAGYAAMIFQIFLAWSWWLPLTAALITAAVSAWWWWEYEINFSPRFALALGVLTIIIAELGLGLMFLPLGHFAAGFLIVWIWYILWLNLRFYLTQEGLNIRKQLPFLITNGLLIVIYFIFVIRWK